MEESSNFIPLGIPRGTLPFDKPEKTGGLEKREGKTAGERKQIAREIRNAAKKEKKLAKADAKRQRKLNAIMNRRMTKNPEKYSKNKERNRARALDKERNKIQTAAIRQAERLAAKHDPSGKMFNVGEMVVLEDGSVKSKESLKVIEERKAQREAEKAAREAGANAGVNPERADQIQEVSQEIPKKGKISKKQQKKRAALEALYNRPPPPRPVLPEGITIPEGEENFIAMWDITDEEIHRRMSNETRILSLARKDLRRRQKEEKRFNQAMKLLKRQKENRGEKWDPEKERADLQRLHEEEGRPEDSQDSDNDAADGDDKFEGAIEPVQVEKVSKKLKKAKTVSEPASNGNAMQSPVSDSETKENKFQRSADNSAEELNAKKSKKSKMSKSEQMEIFEAPAPTKPVEITEKKKKDRKVPSEIAVKEASESEIETVTVSEVMPEKSLQEEARIKKAAKLARKEEKRARKGKKLHEAGKAAQEKEVAEAAEVVAIIAAESSSKKRKHEGKAEVLGEKEKSHKKKKANFDDATNGSAEQWNPEALTGDEARREKFLRLLGAGNINATAKNGAHHKSTAKLEDITKVQSDLERQYEAGMKMKHDGGAKRRGLGA